MLAFLFALFTGGGGGGGSGWSNRRGGGWGGGGWGGGFGGGGGWWRRRRLERRWWRLQRRRRFGTVVSTMNFARLTRHIFMPRRHSRRAFDEAALNAIEKAITDTEKTHGGEVRVALEASLDPAELFRDISPRQRALHAFPHLGVWDTELNNGVLIYVLWADRDVEIVADRGFNGRISAQGMD